MKQNIVSVLAALALLLGNGQAQQNQTTINACVNAKSGQLRIVQAGEGCKSSEYPLEWNTGDSTQSGSPVVVDATGKVVGHYLDFGDVLWQRGDVWLMSTIEGDGFIPGQPSQVLYTQPDCPATDAYLEVPFPNSLSRRAWFWNGEIVYAGNPIGEIEVRSSRGSFSGFVCTNVQGSMRNLGKMVVIPFADLGFTPPFQLR